MNNKVLTIVLIVLLGLFGVNILFKGKKTASFDKTFSDLSIEKIDKIKVNAKNDNPDYELHKEGTTWVGYENDKKYNLNQDRINSFLTALSAIQIQRLAAKSKEKWDQYEVGEESGTRIEVYSGKKSVLDFVVGRFSFDQQSRTATSYLRKTAEEEIYAMDGFASMTLNQDFNGLRYNRITEIESTGISRIELTEQGQKLTLQKGNLGWSDFMGNALDSTMVSSYFSGLEGLTSSSFAETPGDEEIVILNIGKENGESEVLSVTRDSTDFIISTMSGNYFRSDSAGIFKKLVLDFKNLFQ